MKNISIKCNWNITRYNQQIIDFWNELKVLPPSVDPNQRVNETIYVALNEKDRVIGVTSALPKQIDHLNKLWFYNFRTFIHPHYRIPGLVDKMAKDSISLLEQEYIDGATECVGIITLIEDARIQKMKRKAVYPATGLTFIGYTKNKSEIRIKYFKGATI